jgi:hypothetical protein
VLAESLYGVGKVEEDTKTGGGDSPAFITNFLGGPAGNIPGGKVSEAWVLALKIIITPIFRD